MSNRLIEESSPYLQMHANNPVDWYPWGEEAFERAKKEKKLLLISIGYAACHWCHVMEKESFTDPAISEIMNKHFISIKVDREERPDVDELYMSAIQLIGGRGGWPLNAFALPDGRPLYAVTYLPPSQWLELLLKLREFYNKSSDKATEQAIQIEDAMKASEFTAPQYIQNEWPQTVFKEIFERWLPYIDIEKGGYLNAPKFPLPVSWEYFLHYYKVSNDKRALSAISSTLNKMSNGGIFDQIGGGFSRYSVDVDWNVPHFEKMLYDNAQLISLYSHGYQLIKNESYAIIIKKTIDFIKRELLSQDGAFYTSLDADSEGGEALGEGEYYAWTSAEFDTLLGDQSPMIKEFFSITNEGNWEKGKNILHCKFTHEEFSGKHNLNILHWKNIFDTSSSKLLAFRAMRPKPPLDDKILTSWNALMIKGLIDAFFALHNNEYLDLALNNARFLKKNAFQPDGSLIRNLKPGKTLIPGFLDDYAYLADAWIALYLATMDRSWLDEAIQIISKAIQLFEEPGTGLFYYTPLGHDQLSLRKKIIQDNVMPSPTAIMAKIMQVTGIYLANSDLLARSENLAKLMIPQLVTGGPYMASWSSLILNLSMGYMLVTISGANSIEWKNKLDNTFLPGILISGTDLIADSDISNGTSSGETYAIICRNRVCGLPINSFEELLNSLMVKYQL